MQRPVAARGGSRVPARRAMVAWSAARPWVLWMAASLAFGWALAIVWWALLSPQARQEISDQLIIPPGTAAAIRSGSGAAFVPASVSLRPGSRLLVVNNDVEEHEVGNAVIPPGAVAELTAPPEGEGFYCTIHPSGFLGVELTERPGFGTTLAPALLIGIPLGLMAGAAAWVGGKLDSREGEPAAGNSPPPSE